MKAINGLARLFFLGMVIYFGALPAFAQTTEVLLRPTHVDISSAVAQSAVLVSLADYPSDDVRYRLFRGSQQYHCWDADSGDFISSTSYARGPRAYGSPSESATFWIIYRRGNNESAEASYRDRLGPNYDENFQTEVLPVANAIANPFYVTHEEVDFMLDMVGDRLVVLGWDQEEGGTLVTAASTDPETGHFSLAAPVGAVLRRIELRTAGNDIHEAVTGQWPEVQQVVTPSFNPPPSIYRDQVQVAITTTTEEANIRYTINAEQPDESSPNYQEPLMITTNATLQARAFKEGFMPSEVVMGNYRILDNQQWESFDGMQHTSTTYRDETFVGQDGSVWTYVQCAGSLQITGQAITLGRNRTPQAYVESGVVSGGIGTLDLNYMQAFSNDVDLDVFVNDMLVANLTSDNEQGVIKHSGPIEVDMDGDVVIRIIGRENSAGQVTIDNIIWDGFASTSVPLPHEQGATRESFANIYVYNNTLVVNLLDNAENEHTLGLYDMVGRRLMTMPMVGERDHQQQLDLQAGIYLIRLTGRKQQQTGLVVVR